MRVAMAGWLAVAVLAMAMPGLRAQAKGQVRLKRASFTVADAVAYKTDDGVEVALLSTAFDRKAAAKDMKVDGFDVMRSDGASITLRIGADGDFNCIDSRSEEGDGSSCNSDYTPALKLTARTADRIAGSFVLNANGESANVTFDLKVESEVARRGTALPADGGEPGRAVLAHFAAIERNDFKALIATAPPEQQAMMIASEKAGEAKEMFQMLRAMSPRKVRIVGGTVDGDEATVDFEGVEGGKPVTGLAQVERIGGKWYMTGTSNR